MNEPLDYEPRIAPDPRIRRFWLTLFAAELVPVVAVLVLVPSPYKWGATIFVLFGAIVTASGLYVARLPSSYPLAIGAGLVGPVAGAILMLKLVALFK